MALPNFLPPVVVEARSRFGEVYTDLGKVQAATSETLQRVAAESEAAAAESEAAAAKAAARADMMSQKVSRDTSEASVKAAEAAAYAEEESRKAAAGAVEARTQATAAMAEVEASSTTSSKAMGTLNRVGKAALLGVAAGAAIVGYESVKMAGDFQQSVQLLATGAGESKANLGLVSQGILGVSRATGQSADDLAKSMYMVESAGFHGAAGLKVLSAAAEGAKTDGADAADVANALTTVMTDMHAPAASAATVMSQMVAAVGQGKMRMNDLAGSIHSVLPNASALHISFAEVAGALATMTAQGMSADQAAQNLNHTIVSLANPTAVMTKAMAAYGLSSLDVAKNLGQRGLSGTLDLLYGAVMRQSKGGLAMQSAFMANKVAAEGLLAMYSKLPPSVQHLADAYTQGKITAKDYADAVKAMPQSQAVLAAQFKVSSDRAAGFSQALRSGKGDLQTITGAMAQMTGGQVGLQVAMHLTGENASTLAANIRKIGGTSADADGSVRDFHATMKTWNNQVAVAKANVQALAIQIGEKLIPPLSAALGWTLKNGTALKVMAGIIAFVLVPAIAVYTASWVAAAAATLAALWPIYLIIAGLAMMAGVVYFAVRQWQEKWGEMKAVTEAIWNWMVGAWNTASAAITGAFHTAIAGIVGAWGWLKSSATAVIHWVAGIPAMIFHGLESLPKLVAKLLADTATAVMYWIGYALGWAVKQAIDFPANMMRGIQVLYGLAVTFFTTLWQTTVALVSRMVTDVVDWTGRMEEGVIRWVEQLPGRVASFFTTMWRGAVSVMTRLAGDVQRLASQAVSRAVDWFRQLPGRAETFVRQLPAKIKAAVADAGTWLYGAGKAVVMGLVHGMESMAGNAVGAVQHMGGSLISGFKHGMGISSPSRVFAEAGRWIPAGIAQGITAGMPVVHAALAGVPTTVPAGAGGGFTAAPGYSAGGGGGALTAAVPIIIQMDNRTVWKGQQTVTLQYDRRNGFNGQSTFGLQGA